MLRTRLLINIRLVLGLRFGLTKETASEIAKERVDVVCGHFIVDCIVLVGKSRSLSVDCILYSLSFFLYFLCTHPPTNILCCVNINSMSRLVVFYNIPMRDGFIPITFNLNLWQLLTVFWLDLTVLNTTELALMLCFSQLFLLFLVSQRLYPV
mgnify:CR=1 FL=1